MTRKPDVDQLLRSWLDEGNDLPPERYVWAALERIQTTRQRGPIRVSLEEHVMRAQPIASIAAVLIVAAIGLAVYFGLTGGPNVGDPDAAPTPVPGAVETERFTDPLSLDPPDDWVIIESPDSLVVWPLVGSSPFTERIVIFRTAQARLFGGLDHGPMPWPDDLASWLEDYPEPTEEVGPGSLEVTLVRESETTVAGHTATVIETTSSFSADFGFDSVSLISTEPTNTGTDVLAFPGDGQMRFVVLSDRGVVISYHATDAAFSEATFEDVLDSIRFTE